MADKTCSDCGAAFSGDDADKELKQHQESFHPGSGSRSSKTSSKAKS